MTLRVSRNKIGPAAGLFSDTVLKNLGIIILTVVAMLIFCPGFFIATLQEQTFRPENYNQNSPECLTALFGVCGVISVIFVTVANYINFSYLYKKNSSDVFHALPLTRARLLLSRAAAGFVSVLIPVTVGYAALFALTAFYPTYVVGTLSQIASAYLVNILCIMMASAYSLIFIVCAGSAFDLVLSFAGFNAALLVIGLIISAVAEEHLIGYSSENIVEIIKVMSPLAFCAVGASEFALCDDASDVGFSLSANGGFILAVIIYTLVFTVIALILYNYRKAERGGQAYAYKFLYVICSVLAGICGGYLLSRIFLLPSDAGDISVIAGVSFIAGALVTTVAYGAVTDRGFKHFRKSLIYGGISAAVYVVVLAIIMGGAFGFAKRIPDVSKVETASISFDDVYLDIEDASKNNKVIALHKAIVERDADDDIDDEVDTQHTYVRIEYKLKGNGSMWRNYFVDVDKVADELFALYAGDERFEDMNASVDGYKGNIYFETYDYDEGGCVSYEISKDQLRTLINAYKADLRRIGKDIIKADIYGEHSIGLQAYPRDEEYFTSDVDFRINKDFSETLSVVYGFEPIPEIREE